MKSPTGISLILLAACGGAPKQDADLTQGAAAVAESAVPDTSTHVSGRVTLSETAFAAARLVMQVPRALGRTDATTLVVPGQVEADPTRVALITPRTEGRLERLEVAAGQRVEAGQTVAHVFSPPFLTAQAELVQATRRAGALAASPDSSAARGLLSAARRRLALLGAPAPLIDRIERTGEIADFLPVVAPFGGSIVEALALAGAAVSVGTPLFRLVDLSQVDVVGNVPEVELPHLAVGQVAEVVATAYPDTPLSGRIERIQDELDPTTRTVAAVIHVPNPRGTLRPGMFASVRIAVPLGRQNDPAAGDRTGLIIPESALVMQGSDRFVFVQVGDRAFERRLVEVLPLSEVGAGGRRVLVRAGLTPADRVVVAGSFVLKSELAKGELEEH